MNLSISKLLVTQSAMRRDVPITFMSSFVLQGGFWNRDSMDAYAEGHRQQPGPLIWISRFPDALYIHDGHHRLVATFLGGRDYIRDDEYTIHDYSYEKNYIYPNWGIGWVTPFDPRTECRLPDLASYKRKVFSLPEDKAIPFILANKHLYACKREIWTVQQLAWKLS